MNLVLAREGRIPRVMAGLSRPSTPYLAQNVDARQKAGMTVCHCRTWSGNPCRASAQMDHRHRRPKDAVLRTAMPGGDER